MLWNDGPYKVVATFPEHSEYTLWLLSDKKHTFPSFHASLVKQHIPNDPSLFTNREYTHPSPVIMEDGATDHQVINKIINEHRHGHGQLYLVHWVGFPPEHNKWLPHLELDECEVLYMWEAWKRTER
ncbi:hypothetical protein J132_03294 [Termitomyces sp. J132]|nr:hypothetical protein J132_03294 [Termitomyces sp. J132]